MYIPSASICTTHTARANALPTTLKKEIVLSSPLVEYFILSFLHLKKQADRGGSAPYWLGAAQLWRAVVDQ